jgi:hypothetical protein
MPVNNLPQSKNLNSPLEGIPFSLPVWNKKYEDSRFLLAEQKDGTEIQECVEKPILWERLSTRTGSVLNH